MTLRSYQVVLQPGVVHSLARVALEHQEEVKFLQLVITVEARALLGGPEVTLGDPSAALPAWYGLELLPGHPLTVGPFTFGAIRLEDYYLVAAQPTVVHLLGIPA